MDARPSLRVDVFESANPDFYLAHFDLPVRPGMTTAVGPSGLPSSWIRSSASPSLRLSHREDSRLCHGCEQRVCPRLRHALRVAREQATGPPEVGVGVILAAAVRNASHIWSAAAARSKSFSARTTSTATLPSDTDTSIGHFPMSNWAASSTRSRAGSPPSIGVLSWRRRISSTSLPSADRLLDALNSFQTALTWPETQQRVESSARAGAPAGC